MAKSADTFTCIKTEGAILPSDLLNKIAIGHADIDGLKETDYFLVEGEKLSEAISRSWARLISIWEIFNKELAKLPENDPAIGLTRSKWLLPLFQELGYGQLQRSNVTVIDGKEYPISHFHDRTPIHLVGSGLSIDRRSRGVAGAARISPHGLVQEFLNRTDYLWAFVSNGLYLRILRDNVSLTRQAYVEFDVKAIMDGQVYSDFSLLWLLCHSSRITIPEGKTSEDCWLEKWSKNAIQQGTRVMEDLRVGVEKAIACLGSGFLVCRNNNTLREKLRGGQLDKQDYYRQLLRIVYRLIFLFVAEDRDLLLLPDTPKDVKETYLKYYSTRRLRNLAQKHKGTQHCDLWQSLRLIFTKLHKQGCPELGLPALGSFLWNPQFTQDLEDCNLTNRDFLEAIRSLAYTIDNSSLRQIDYKNLGSEELGSVYESLLELHPQLHIQTAGFELKAAAGHERKTTGSYYTPTPLINCLLDSALNPVIDAAAKKESPEKAILNLKVCDPACGSGHFLVAAAHRIAKRLASVRGGEEEPSPEDTRKALRDVISHCIYGVDINPMSVELCKISLWLEAIEPGKPLSFLDHHIKCGNSLLGTNPALMVKGIPDEAFEPIEGDIKQICAANKKQNKEERKKGQKFMLFDDGKEYPWDKLGSLSTAYNQIEEFSDDTISSQENKQKRYEEFVKSSSYEFGHQLADAWCAAFVIEKSKKFSYVITENIFREIERKPFELAPWLKEEIKRLSKQYQFFHWHLEFPSVFKVPGKNEQPENEQTGLSGGFDCVLGNPPWEKLKIMEVEFFASRDIRASQATTQSLRHKIIDELKKSNSPVYEEYIKVTTEIENQNRLIRGGVFKYSACGELNTYALFTELALNMLSVLGRAGIIVKSSIATASTYGPFFEILVKQHLVSLYDFKNWALYFPTVGFHERYALLTLIGQKPRNTSTKIGFQLVYVQDIQNTDLTYMLDESEFKLFSPTTGTCPLFTDGRQKKIAEKVYNKYPILVDEANKSNEWNLKYITLFHMSADSELFLDLNYLINHGFSGQGGGIVNLSDGLYFPLYEGKYFQQYDHRFATYGGIPGNERYTRKAATATPSVQQKQNPFYEIEPRYWMPEDVFKTAISKQISSHEYYIVARLVTNVISNVRSVISCIMPAFPCNNLAVILGIKGETGKEYATNSLIFQSLLSSIPFDFIARIKMSENLLKGTLWEIAAPSPHDFEKEFSNKESYLSFCLPRSFELSYTTWSLLSLAKDLDMNIPPFVWDEERRFKIRCELDAAFFHLYDINRDDIGYILDTFPILKRRDEEQYDGKYRTKELILEVYDKMAEAIRTSQAYQTILNPPPGDPRCSHPAKGH